MKQIKIKEEKIKGRLKSMNEKEWKLTKKEHIRAIQVWKSKIKMNENTRLGGMRMKGNANGWSGERRSYIKRSESVEAI